MGVEHPRPSASRMSRRLRKRSTKSRGELASIPHRHHASVGSVLGVASHQIRHDLRHRSTDTEEPGEKAKHRSDHETEHLYRLRPLSERRSGCGGHVVEKPTDARQAVDGDEKPLLHRESDRVGAEVMAELVGQHSAQGVMIERAHGVRSDHDQMPTAGECVQLVVIHDANGEAMISDVEGLGDLVESGLEARGLVRQRSPSTDQACQDRSLNERNEQEQTDQCVQARCRPVSDRPDEGDEPPKRGHGQEKDRNHGDERNEAGPGGPVDSSSRVVPHSAIVAASGLDIRGSDLISLSSSRSRRAIYVS